MKRNSSLRHFSFRPWLGMLGEAQLIPEVRVSVNITDLVGREIKPRAIVDVGQKRSSQSKG